MVTCSNHFSFCDWAAWKYFPYCNIWYWCFGFTRKAFPPTIFLESKFVHQMRQTRIPIMVSFLFVIGHCKHVFLIGIHNIDALVSQEELFFRIKVRSSNEITWILILNSITFVVANHKHVLLIGMHTIDALVSKENLFFPPFSLESKFIWQHGYS